MHGMGVTKGAKIAILSHLHRLQELDIIELDTNEMNYNFTKRFWAFAAPYWDDNLKKTGDWRRRELGLTALMLEAYCREKITEGDDMEVLVRTTLTLRNDMADQMYKSE